MWCFLLRLLRGHGIKYVFPRCEVRFEVVEIRMERKGVPSTPTSKRKKNQHPYADFCSHEANYLKYEFPLQPRGGSRTAQVLISMQNLCGISKSRLLLSSLLILATIVADACDCPIRPISNCLLIF